MKINIIKYLLVAGSFSFLLLDAQHTNASYYRIEKMVMSGGGEDKVLCIYDRDGERIDWMELNEHREKNFRPFHNTGIKPRPIKAILRNDKQIGRVVGFFDKRDLLIGVWQKYDGSLDLRPDESDKFSNFDAGNLQTIIDQTLDDHS